MTMDGQIRVTLTYDELGLISDSIRLASSAGKLTITQQITGIKLAERLCLLVLHEQDTKATRKEADKCL